jgi:cardiolipin synthase
MESFLLSEDYFKHLNTYSHSKNTKNNELTFFPSGAQSYEKRWELLEGAKKSIHIVSFSLMNDKTTAKLRDVLIDKLKQGVEVKMMFDDGVNLTTFSGGKIREVIKHGGEVVRFNHFFQGWMPDISKGHPLKHFARTGKLKLKKHFHEKYMVVDGREAILGGINWGDKYAFGGIDPKAWRDSDAYVSGPVVKEIQCQFIRDYTRYQAWDRAAKQNRFSDYNTIMRQNDYLTNDFIESHFSKYFPSLEAKGNQTLRYIAHKPYDDNVLNLTNAFLYTIKNAKDYIYWGCHGIRPPYIMGEYLADAVARGVEVRLITNSKYSSKSLMLNGLMGWMYVECTKHFKWLLERGVRIFEWQNPGAFHSKNMVVDDVFATVGSYNIARGSTYHHTESNIFIHGGEMPVKFKERFFIDFQSCKEIKLDDVISSLPYENAFARPVHERDFLIHPDLLTPAVKEKLSFGYYKRILT